MEEAKKVALEEEDERCEMDGHIFSIGTWEMFGDVGWNQWESHKTSTSSVFT